MFTSTSNGTRQLGTRWIARRTRFGEKKLNSMKETTEMPRELTSHKVNGLNEALKIEVLELVLDVVVLAIALLQ